ncbi:MAG: Lrp/AsnC ligand binding domain-containing protein [Candidatus Nezhaarchaeales archaeon]|nr:MAG: Lrp/AsnC family transcriptional regulator [Candidatus Nezhaarchaeota archaeon WYZ-LMO7]
MINACILMRTERGRSDDVVAKVKQLGGVKVAFSTLGRYDVVVDIEVEDFKTLGQLVQKISRLSGVVFTETLVELQA